MSEIPTNSLEKLRAAALMGGGASQITRQHDKGKLTARERLDLLLEPTDLGTIIAQVVAEYHPRVEAKGQTLCVRVPDGLARALCDRTRAAQIVGNLVSNAHKYTPPGGTITLSLGPAPDEGFLEVVVADTGVGIAPEEREHLFHRFYRTDSARRTGEGGTGLGLHIARSLVDLHGGRVWFESQVGRGTVFHATFPATEARLAD